jgi:hypothetical protein
MYKGRIEVWLWIEKEESKITKVTKVTKVTEVIIESEKTR